MSFLFKKGFPQWKVLSDSANIWGQFCPKSIVEKTHAFSICVVSTLTLIFSLASLVSLQPSHDHLFLSLHALFPSPHTQHCTLPFNAHTALSSISILMLDCSQLKTPYYIIRKHLRGEERRLIQSLSPPGFRNFALAQLNVR